MKKNLLFFLMLCLPLFVLSQDPPTKAEDAANNAQQNANNALNNANNANNAAGNALNNANNELTPNGVSTSTFDKLGIGTADPKGEMHVVGNLVLGLDQNNKKFIFHPRTNGSGDFLQITNDVASGAWDWHQGLLLYRGGNVSIGTFDHVAKLTVNGKVKIIGGSPGLGKVLTSDATGMATWQAPLSSALPTNPQDGTIAYYNSGAWQALTPGTDGQVLTLNGSVPAWEDPD